MVVDVDESRGEDQALPIDDELGVPFQGGAIGYLGDPVSPDCDLASEGWGSRPVHDD